MIELMARPNLGHRQHDRCPVVDPELHHVPDALRDVEKAFLRWLPRARTKSAATSVASRSGCSSASISESDTQGYARSDRLGEKTRKDEGHKESLSATRPLAPASWARAVYASSLVAWSVA
jgi:hypothetical protein